MALVILVRVYALRRMILIGQGLVFTGIAYLLVYIGAIAILFLFVIMLLDTRRVKIGRAFEGRILAFGLGCIVYLPCILMEKDLTLFNSSFDR
jgi:NADH:ubiquinone oxidoreductase subunit 6 (subunit J)